ncbi:hypothetical protein T05_10874 [Trichinella murrelli]|uniref:Uncharacterized protein n=1 Tax=Trichinella murrelli TaxID=144512 RepID=A0A0V0SSM1_9BILA|nr:hypothetical protein T05_10874 [Trichinella murrelli]
MDTQPYLSISVNLPWNSEDDSTTSPPRISGRFFYNGHPAAYQITAVGQQVTSY